MSQGNGDGKVRIEGWDELMAEVKAIRSGVDQLNGRFENLLSTNSAIVLELRNRIEDVERRLTAAGL